MANQRKSFNISTVCAPDLQKLVDAAGEHRPPINLSAIVCPLLLKHLPGALREKGMDVGSEAKATR